jgi:hypothetical protein
MKTLTADEILEKTFQHLKAMVNERNQENRHRNKKGQNVTDRHTCPKNQLEKEEFVVEQELNDDIVKKEKLSDRIGKRPTT